MFPFKKPVPTTWREAKELLVKTEYDKSIFERELKEFRSKSRAELLEIVEEYRTIASARGLHLLDAYPVTFSDDELREALADLSSGLKIDPLRARRTQAQFEGSLKEDRMEGRTKATRNTKLHAWRKSNRELREPLRSIPPYFLRGVKDARNGSHL